MSPQPTVALENTDGEHFFEDSVFIRLFLTLVLYLPPTDGGVGGVDGPTHNLDEQLEEPAVKKQRTEE